MHRFDAAIFLSRDANGLRFLMDGCCRERYAIMVGCMASKYNAHTTVAIDRRITNRHLMLLGGYSRGTMELG